MFAPAAAAKILVPETEDFDSSMSITKDKMGANVLKLSPMELLTE